MGSLEQLHRAWENRNLIPFVGSGVSQGAAGLPSWPALLSSGIEYVQRNRQALGAADSLLADLASAIRDGKLLDGFGMLQQALGVSPNSDHYQAFLLEQFDQPTVSNPATLEGIRSLRARVVITTNYDLLLEQNEVVPGGETATWLQPQKIFSLLRGGKGVIHLHGRYDHPESVILSAADYSRIVGRPEDSIRVAQALFHAGVLLFVGSSLAGVQDPHLSRMLDEFARLQGPLLDGVQPHFILLRKDAPKIEIAAARRMGILPVTFTDYSDLPAYLRSIVGTVSSHVSTDRVRDALLTLRGARSLREVFDPLREFIEKVIFPGRPVRIGFASKITEDGRTLLRNQYLLPGAATHNDFSYPQTLAAWSLIEGQILAIPEHLTRACDLEMLRKISKYNRVRDALLQTSGADDPLVAEFLNEHEIRTKTDTGRLTIGDLYQNWVSGQPVTHYRQFVSVPVPVVERRSNRVEPPEYGVFNIDSPEPEPLLTETTAPLLKLISDVAALAFHLFQRKRAAGSKRVAEAKR
jgi:hypothetical protein